MEDPSDPYAVKMEEWVGEVVKEHVAVCEHNKRKEREASDEDGGAPGGAGFARVVASRLADGGDRESLSNGSAAPVNFDRLNDPSYFTTTAEGPCLGFALQSAFGDPSSGRFVQLAPDQTMTSLIVHVNARHQQEKRMARRLKKQGQPLGPSPTCCKVRMLVRPADGGDAFPCFEHATVPIAFKHHADATARWVNMSVCSSSTKHEADPWILAHETADPDFRGEALYSLCEAARAETGPRRCCTGLTPQVCYFAPKPPSHRTIEDLGKLCRCVDLQLSLKGCMVKRWRTCLRDCLQEGDLFVRQLLDSAENPGDILFLIELCDLLLPPGSPAMIKLSSSLRLALGAAREESEVMRSSRTTRGISHFSPPAQSAPAQPHFGSAAKAAPVPMWASEPAVDRPVDVRALPHDIATLRLLPFLVKDAKAAKAEWRKAGNAWLDAMLRRRTVQP